MLFAESKQTLLILWYRPVLQYPLCLSEALHESVDKAIELLSLTGTKTEIKTSEGVGLFLSMCISSHVYIMYLLMTTALCN